VLPSRRLMTVRYKEERHPALGLHRTGARRCTCAQARGIAITMAAVQSLVTGTSEDAASAVAHAVPRASRTMPQYARFLVVGVSNAILDLGVLNVLAALAPPHDPVRFLAENSAAVACALVNSYVWNARWTFRGRGSGTLREGALFFAQALLNLLLNNAVLLATVSLMPVSLGLWPSVATNIAKVCAMLAASTMSFFVLRGVVFRGR
jgi:putative flippase GtrA